MLMRWYTRGKLSTNKSTLTQAASNLTRKTEGSY